MYCEEKQNECKIYGIKDFSLKHIFECGQCFRWKPNTSGGYSGVAGGRYAEVYYEDNVLTIKGANIKDVNDFWFNYFDLARDYKSIKEELSGMDEFMEKAVKHGNGIRILNQEPFETLISFIVSANNNIPRISGIIEKLCSRYGNKIEDNVFTFPSPKELSNTEVCDVSECSKAGYRCGYIIDSAKMFSNKPFTPDDFKNCDVNEARKIMQTYKGVGPKVADCVLLFSGSRQDVFPVDVWVKRVMNKLYGVSSHKEINEFAMSYFGNLSGFAQQYLFYAIRENYLEI